MLDLSVIVPVYNMAKDGNLEYCINSLVRQTLQSMEIIAVDDASTDDSLRILQEFEKKYPGRVKAIRNTLFSYMQSNRKKEIGVLKKLGEEMVSTFPDFRQNPYYLQNVNDYEQKLINLHLKSTPAFLFVYELKQLSKKIRRKKNVCGHC